MIPLGPVLDWSQWCNKLKSGKTEIVYTIQCKDVILSTEQQGVRIQGYQVCQSRRSDLRKYMQTCGLPGFLEDQISV